MYKSPQSTNHNLILNVAMGFDRNVSPSRLIRTCLFSYNNAPRPHRVHRLTLSCNMLHATYIIDDLQMLSSPFKLASSRSHCMFYLAGEGADLWLPITLIKCAAFR